VNSNQKAGGRRLEAEGALRLRLEVGGDRQGTINERRKTMDDGRKRVKVGGIRQKTMNDGRGKRDDDKIRTLWGQACNIAI
jgi:hypothetical protein